MNRTAIIITAFLAFSIILACFLYLEMPEQMASHWNAKGQVDGYMPKLFGLFMMPMISLICLVLFIFLPKIDPLKENIKKFRIYYDGFILVFMMFMLYLYFLTLLWNLGVRFSMIKMLMPSFGILFYYIGVLLKNARRNWFIGIRTPWTLSNDKVWGKTHELGGKLYKIAAVFALLGFIFEDYAIWFVLLPITTVSLFTVIYSYYIFQKK